MVGNPFPDANRNTNEFPVVDQNIAKRLEAATSKLTAAQELAAKIKTILKGAGTDIKRNAQIQDVIPPKSLRTSVDKLDVYQRLGRQLVAQKKIRRAIVESALFFLIGDKKKAGKEIGNSDLIKLTMDALGLLPKNENELSKEENAMQSFVSDLIDKARRKEVNPSAKTIMDTLMEELKKI